MADFRNLRIAILLAVYRARAVNSGCTTVTVWPSRRDWARATVANICRGHGIAA